MSLEVVLGVQIFPEDTVVVDLAVDGEGEGLIIVDEGLGAGVWMNSLARIPSYVPIESSPTDTNDTQTLMRQDYKSPPLVFSPGQHLDAG